MCPIDNDRFQQIAGRYTELEAERGRLNTERLSLFYNTGGNSNHPQAFVTLEDAQTHESLTERLHNVQCCQTKLANEVVHESFPTDRRIKLEGPDMPNDEATGIILREHTDGSCELQVWDWSLVLAEG